MNNIKKLRPWKQTILTAVLLSMLLYSCGQQRDRTKLAVFDGGTVTQKEYIDHFLSSTIYKPGLMPSEKNLLDIVFQKAMEKIAILEARSRKMDTDSALVSGAKKIADTNLAQKYMKAEVISKVVTDSLIKKFYDSFTPQYQMRYILRIVSNRTPATTLKAQQDTINIIYKLLRKGQKFEDLAKEYSQDMVSKSKGGDIGYVIKESLGDAKMREVMEALPEESYSKPFLGVSGFYILYKGKKRDVSVPEFEKVRAKIWLTLYRTRRYDIEQQAKKLFKALAPSYHFKLNKSAVKQIIQKAKIGKTQKGDNFLLEPGLLTKKELSLVLASCDGGKVTGWNVFADRKKAPTDKREFDKRFDLLTQQMVFAQDARRKGYNNTPEFKNTEKDILDAFLRQGLYQKEVKDIVNVKIDSLREKEKDILSPHDLRLKLVEQRTKLENRYRTDFEKRMKEKYHFKYIEKNFAGAIKAAAKRKKEENEKRKQAKK
ncbi:MAG: hypothetical protein GXO75_01090 [Calditrichaeota bacterium]|nr:hypothetical protein [Calditrichota bacterium]